MMLLKYKRFQVKHHLCVIIIIINLLVVVLRVGHNEVRTLADATL